MKDKSRLRSGETGQAILEYVLLLTMIISISGLMLGGVQIARDKMWKKVLCDVSPACPDCRSPESAKNALPNAGVNCKK